MQKSAGVEVGRLEHVVNGLGMYPEGPSNTNRGQFAVVHQAVHRHLGHPHQRRHLGDSEELCPGLLAVNGAGVTPLSCRISR